MPATLVYQQRLSSEPFYGIEIKMSFWQTIYVEQFHYRCHDKIEGILKPDVTIDDLFVALSSPTYFEQGQKKKMEDVDKHSHEASLDLISSVLGEVGAVLQTSNMLNLRVRSPRGDHVFNLKSNSTDTVASLRRSLEYFYPTTASCQLVLMASAGGLCRTVLEDDDQTLAETGINESAVLFMELIHNDSPLGVLSRGTSP